MIIMNQEEIKEEQEQANNRYNNIREIAENFFNHYFNNYWSTSLMAEHYAIDESLIKELIKLGKKQVKKRSQNQDNFVDYIMKFYNDIDGLNPIKNLTRKEVRKAVKYYQNKITKDNLDYYSWGDGDSIDRERVRDIILKLRSQKWILII